MKQPTQEQIKEFWKWCEQLTECYWCKGTGRRFYTTMLGKTYPCPSCESKGYHYPDTTLNNLDRYAIPKVLEKYDIKIFSFYDDLNDKVFWFTHILDRETGEIEFANVEGQEELKDALFEALWQVKEGSSAKD